MFKLRVVPADGFHRLLHDPIASRRMAWSVFPESRPAEAFQSVDFLEKFCSGALRPVETTNE